MKTIKIINMIFYLNFEINIGKTMVRQWKNIARQPEKHCSTIILPLSYHCFSNIIDLKIEINIILISIVFIENAVY